MKQATETSSFFSYEMIARREIGRILANNRFFAIEILAADLYYTFRDWVSNVWMKFEPWKYYKRNADKLPGNGRIY